MIIFTCIRGRLIAFPRNCIATGTTKLELLCSKRKAYDDGDDEKVDFSK